MPQQKDYIQAQKGRTASLVIAGSMLIWFGMQWAAVELHISSRYMLLLDLLYFLLSLDLNLLDFLLSGVLKLLDFLLS